MKKLDGCGNCKHFDSNNNKLGICTNYESDRIGYLLPANHYCKYHELAKPKEEYEKEYSK